LDPAEGGLAALVLKTAGAGCAQDGQSSEHNLLHDIFHFCIVQKV
jgi:hypothetical protein